MKNSSSMEVDGPKMKKARPADDLPPRCFSREDLAPFDLLERPVWIFDIEKKAMWWANTAAVALWNADSLESLVARDFASDMSEGTKKRINSYLETFRNGGTLKEQYTFYPNGKAVTIDVNIRGIHGDDGRILMLNEGDMPRVKQEIDQIALRRVEILRHLPLAVAQFDSTGRVMEQNPEASDVFGGTNSTGPSFVERFADKSQGVDFLRKVLAADEFCHLEVQLRTKKKGELGWFALKAGQRKDPVTSETVIIYSARDISEVRRAKEEADRVHLEKSEFLAVMAHEIRTPLHQVIGFGELLSQTMLTKQQQEYVQYLETSSKGLMTVINDALDYTKLEAGKMKLEKISFEVQEVIAGVALAISTKIEAKGLIMDQTVCKDVPNQVVGDPTRLRQVLLNLAHNAFKFTEKGKITLDVQRLEDESDHRFRLRFEVQDTGIGISQDSKTKLFQKYQQASASTSRTYGGTGLGLAICKLIVEAMGGRLGVESVLGKGSTFWFELPFERVSSVSSDCSEGKLALINEPRELDILVAEDNQVNQKLAVALLKRLGHRPTVANNGLEALQKIKESEYDLVFMDVQMPVMDGMEATKKIRELVDQSNLPVIGLTADFRKSELSKYTDIGMNDCIGKPLRVAELKHCIRSVLESANQSEASILYSLECA